MAKTQKITPTIATILAQKIVAGTKENTNDLDQIRDVLNKEVNAYPEVKEGLKMMKQLEMLNKKIKDKIKKHTKKDEVENYFTITKEDKQYVSRYWLKECNPIPSVSTIKDEILLEAFFSDDVSPDTIVQQYVKKYTSK